MIKLTETPIEEMLCTTCKTPVGIAAPTKRVVERLAARMPFAGYEYPLCGSCINILRTNQLPMWTGRIADLREKALWAIRSDEYAEYANCERMVASQISQSDAEIRDLLEKIGTVNKKQVEMFDIQRQLTNALNASPNASYFLRRIAANKAISGAELRHTVFSRDKYRCVKCSSREKLTIDHVIPVLVGGGDEPENLQTLCKSCNSSKGSRIETPTTLRHEGRAWGRIAS